MLKESIIVSVVALILIRICIAAEFPENIQKCHYGDSTCLTEVSQSIIKEHSNGLPALNLVQLDPVLIDKIALDDIGIGAFNLRLNFDNISVHGFKDITFTRITGFPEDFDGSENEIEFTAPLITIAGHYAINGKILIVTLKESGQSSITLENIKVRLSFTGRRISNDGQDYFQAENPTMTMTTTQLTLNFANLLSRGKKSLEKWINAFLNDNSKDIFTEIHPNVTKAVAGAILQLINDVFATFPYKELFLE